MGLAERLVEVDRELDGLGPAHGGGLHALASEWSGVDLSDVDQALSDLAQGVVVATRSEHAPQATHAPVEAKATVEPTDTVEAKDTVQDVPTPAIEGSAPVAFDAPARAMSEPPPSMVPPPPEDDDDPFAGQPAPMPVPERARRSSLPPAAAPTAPTTPPRATPSVMPMSVPAPPKRTPRTIRTSVAPPPLPSSRPLSMRPTDTPDPFAPPNLASSRPPAPRGGLDADDLFGGASSVPPAGGLSLKPGALTAPKPPSPDKTDPPGTQAAADGEDDFELLVDDEMLEIDIEEELD